MMLNFFIKTPRLLLKACRGEKSYLNYDTLCTNIMRDRYVPQGELKILYARL